MTIAMITRLNHSSSGNPWVLAALSVLTTLLAPTAASAQAETTYAEHVAPILNTHCVVCHRPGAIGPFSLATFADAQARADRIAEVVADLTMPPWKPAPFYGPFHGEPEMTADETDRLVAWAANGAPMGDATDAPPPPTFDDAWPLGEPDLIVSMDAAYTVSPGSSIEHRNFVLPVELTERRWVRAVDVRPGGDAGAVVRRARVMIDASRAGRRADGEDDVAGYPGLVLDHAGFPAGHFLVWAPGQTPVTEQPGLAWPLDPGTDLILQLALHARTEAVPVQASIGLYFAEEPPAFISVGLSLNSKSIDIPAGEAAYVVRDRYRLPVAVDLLGLFPYMHHLGKEVEVTAALPDGTELGLLKIEEWDFNWQDGYRYTEPVHLPENTSIEARFTFDNSSDNPRNPSSPPVAVRHGPEMTNEMAEVLLQVLPILSGDVEALVGNLVLKQTRNDILGFQARLRSDPNDAMAHDDLAVRYLSIGQLELARDHLGQAMALDPAFAEPHFNLASLLVAEGNTPGAIEEFRRAVEIAPDYAEAHNNLGALLASTGMLDDAMVYYQLALQFDPGHSGALYNLANALLAQGNHQAAIGHYRDAIAGSPNDAEVHNNLARALAATDDLSDAVTHYQRAIEINPSLAPALIGLSWIRATAPNDDLRRSAEALMLAEQTVRLVGAEHPEVLDTLAAAYASAGRFDDAIATARKAAAAARATPGYESTALAIDARVSLYLVFKPYRTP